MADLRDELPSLGRLVDPRWTDARASKVEAALARKRRDRARSRRVLLSMATVCMLSVVGGLGWASLQRRLARPAPAAEVVPGVPAAPLATGHEIPEPQPAPAAPADRPVETSPPTETPPTPTVRAVATVSTAWRNWARDGDYDNAFKSLKAAGPAAVRDDTGDLLLASDVARLSGHAPDAVDPLHRVLSDHAADPRAPLAAFTLGRVLLDELGRPAEAATAFARARTLAPGGPLDEDALAREVEALSRAGETNRARDAAEAYLARYPNGRRVRSVRRFGGLD